MRAAYVRVSDSDKQSPERQVEAIEAKYHIDRWYMDSGSRDKALKRKAFQKLLADLPELDEVIVTAQDRFGSGVHYEFASYIWQLQQNNVKLFDLQGDDLSDVTPAAIIQTTVGSITSTCEQETKAERAVTAKVSHARQALSPGGVPSFGLDHVCLKEGEEIWRCVYETRDKRRKVYPDGREERFDGKGNVPSRNAGETLSFAPTIEKGRRETVQRIFQMYNEGFSPGRISQILNAEGVTMTGSDFNKVKLHALLRNPAMIGKPAWNKRGGSRFIEHTNGQAHKVETGAKPGRYRDEDDWVMPEEPIFPPLVSEELWQSVQDRIKKAKQGKRSPAQTQQLFLRDSVYCWHCGQKMRCFNRKNTKGYCCSTYALHGRNNKTGCQHHVIRHEVLSPLVREYIDHVVDMLEPFTRKPPHPLQIEAAELELVDAYEELYESDHEELAEELAEQEQQLEQATGAFLTLPPELQAPARKKLDELQKQVEDTKAKLAGVDSVKRCEEHLETLIEEHRRWLSMHDVWREGAYMKLREGLPDLVRVEVKFEHNGNRSKPTEVIIKPRNGDSQEVVALGLGIRSVTHKL